MASARRHATATPSTWPSESLRVSCGSRGRVATLSFHAGLVCWDFMTTFRDSPVLPARDDNSFLMLPETRLDEFAAALQAPNDDLIRRPEQHNPFRYLAHVHKELLKLIMTDDETDRWWPSPKKSYGPRWWARPELPQKAPPLLQRFEAATPSQPSRIMCQIGAIQATGQPVHLGVPRCCGAFTPSR